MGKPMGGGTAIQRREFLRLTSGMAVGILGYSALVTSCDRSPTAEEEEDGSGPGETPFVVMMNPTDPLLVRTTSSTGATVEYYGTREPSGVPSRVDQVVVTKGGESHRFELGANSLPSRIHAASGVQFLLEWVSATKAVMTVISQNGSQQVNTEVNFATTGKQVSAVPRVAHSFAGLAPRGSQPVRLRASSGLSLAAPAETAGQTSGVTVNVMRCGTLDPGQGSVNVLVFNTTNQLITSIPAVRVSEGTYRATIPANVTPTYNPQEICNRLQGVLGTPCTVLDALGPGATAAVCQSLSVAIDLLTLPSGEAVPLIAACSAAVPAWETYCQTLNQSGAGGPSVAKQLCKGTFENRAIKTDVLVRAQVIGLPTNSSSEPVRVAPGAPFPTLIVDMGGEPSIRSLALSPSNPGEGVTYVATANVFCVPKGSSVSMSVAGTDGYADSKTVTVSETQINGLYSLSVPGGKAGVRDQVTLRVNLPSGQALSRVASVVFG